MPYYGYVLCCRVLLQFPAGLDRPQINTFTRHFALPGSLPPGASERAGLHCHLETAECHDVDVPISGLGGGREGDWREIESTLTEGGGIGRVMNEGWGRGVLGGVNLLGFMLTMERKATAIGKRPPSQSIKTYSRPSEAKLRGETAEV